MSKRTLGHQPLHGLSLPLPSLKEHSPLENEAGPLHNPSFSGKGRGVKVNRGQPRWRPPMLQGPTVASQQTVQSLARAQSPSIAGRHEARDPALISTDTKPSTTPRVKQGPTIRLQASKPQGSPGVPPLQGWLPPAYLVALLVVGAWGPGHCALCRLSPLRFLTSHLERPAFLFAPGDPALPLTPARSLGQAARLAYTCVGAQPGSAASHTLTALHGGLSK